MARRPEWRPRAFGARWQFAFFHALIRLGGRRAAYLISDLVSLWYVATRSAIRRRCAPYLSHRFPDKRGWRRFLDAWRLSKAFARIMVDRAAMERLGSAEFDTRFSGRKALQELLAEGRGLVIVTAHVGSWQLGMANLKVLPRPIAILAQVETWDMNHPFQATRDGVPIFHRIDPQGHLGGIPEMLLVLQQGGVVCLMGDRVFGSVAGTVAVDFLGESLSVPYSPYKLASATGAPVAVLFPYKASRDQHELRIAKVIRVPPDLGRRPDAYRPYAQAFADALAEFTREFPYHFFNFYDLWHGVDPAAGPAR